MRASRYLPAWLAVLGLACSGSPGPAVAPIESPAGPGSAEPNLAVGDDGRLYLSWIEPEGAGHALRFSRREGDGWSAPRTIARGANWFVNWADFPAMAALADGTLFAHWLEKEGKDTYAYGIRVVISRDGGETWSEPVAPHRDGTETEHGFVSMAPAGADRVSLAWLDGREMTGGHGGHGEGSMTLRHATLDAAGNLGDEELLDPRVCECCATDIALGTGGSPVVVYRDRSDEEIRDIRVVRRTGGGWSEPVLVHADLWRINGCPVNGPAIAMEGADGAVAWFTAADGEAPRVQVAFTADGGAGFGEPTAVDAGRPLGRVDLVVLDDGAALVSWLEETEGGGAEILIRRVERDGTRGPVIPVAETLAARRSGFPRMARTADGVFLAWTDAGEAGGVGTAVYR